MKKIFSLFILCALTLLALCLASCNSNSNSNGDNGNAAEQDIFYVTVNGTKVALGDDAEPVMNALGEATSVKSVGNCGGLGEQIKYTYPSIVIYTLKADGKETIDQIDLLDDLVTTSAGIYIGSAASDVEASYGTPTKQTDSSIQYKEGNCYLAFGIKDGEVASITFMRETN